MHSLLKETRVLIVLVCALLFTVPKCAYGENQSEFTARQCFSLIPSDFFEYTPYPISEKEKNSLAEEGVSPTWVIDQDSKDLLTITAEDKTTVYLRIFRSGEYSIAAYTTTDRDNFCVSELWLINKAGQAIPMNLPDEPRPEDFFTKGKQLPPDFSSTCTYCGFQNGLEALPSFAVGGVPQKIDRDLYIYYIWNGTEFIRQSRNISDR